LERARDAREQACRTCAEIITGLDGVPGVAGAHIFAPNVTGSDVIRAVLRMLPSRR
jgi:hypothetical protein